LKILFGKLSWLTVSIVCLGFFFFLFLVTHLILNDLTYNLGLKNQLLSQCPGTPNCVSSQEINTQNSIQPITYEDSLRQAKERIYLVINSMRGTKIIVKDDLYLHVEFTTQLLRFIDDVEFFFDESQSLIHVRSVSRRGYWDLGVNRRRVETIRSKFEKLKNEND
tara:strand:- start:66 stop:560 length:495 start_codon:yes stop_codon:yes gene_type:complete